MMGWAAAACGWAAQQALEAPAAGGSICPCKPEARPQLVTTHLTLLLQAANELAMRLYFLYNSDNEPLLSAGQLASLTAAEGGSNDGTADSAGGGSASGAGSGAAAEGQEGCQEGGCTDLVDPVPPELRERLAHYRAIACLPYYYEEGAWGIARRGIIPARLPCL